MCVCVYIYKEDTERERDKFPPEPMHLYGIAYFPQEPEKTNPN